MEIETPASQSRNIQTNGAPRTSEIPEVLIEEIFLKLPVKSLWRFRLVTKPWRSLIDSDRFIRKHLQYSTRNPSLAHHRVLLALHIPSARITSLGLQRALFASRNACLSSQFSLLSIFNRPDVHPLDFNFPTNVPLKSISLVGCCNGLVCALLNDERIILWNPSTRIFKNLPATCEYMQRERIMGTTCYGIGYDESSGDYKVFWCVSLNNKSAYTVYSLKTDSWKITNVVDNPLRCWGQGKLASGKLHWKGTYTEAGHYRWKIVSFDLSREEYGIVEQPCYSEGGFQPLLGKVGECLSVVCYYNTCIHVWVMKEYGVKESWERVSDVLIPPWLLSLPLFPLCIGPEGEIVFIQGQNIMIYYKDNWFRLAGVGRLSVLDEADFYVESLVSPLPHHDRNTQKRKMKSSHHFYFYFLFLSFTLLVTSIYYESIVSSKKT